MARTKRGVVSRAKHNKVLKTVKGQRGTTAMSKQDGKIVKSYMPYSLRG